MLASGTEVRVRRVTERLDGDASDVDGCLDGSSRSESGGAEDGAGVPLLDPSKGAGMGHKGGNDDAAVLNGAQAQVQKSWRVFRSSKRFFAE